MRSFLISMTIGFFYQLLLSANNFYLTNYLFSNNRETLFQKNKEGVFTMIGYLSISLAGESVFYKINSILNEK